MPGTTIPATIPEGNITENPLELHMELLNMQTQDVWLRQQPVTPEEFRAFKPEPPFVKAGLARSAMDYAYFRRSPGQGSDGPVETRDIGGLRFSRVARPVAFRGFAPGNAPTRILVEKHHVIGFNAGTRVHFAQLPNGAYYVIQTTSANGSVISEPAEWKCYYADLESPWECALQCPAEVYFFSNLRSFVGPLAARDMPAGLQEVLRERPA